MVGHVVLTNVIFQITYKCIVVGEDSQGNFTENFAPANFVESNLLEHLNTRNIIQPNFGMELFDSQLFFTCVVFLLVY